MKKLQILKTFELRIGKHFSINIWFFPVIASAFWSGYGRLFLLTFSIALFHELAHIFCAKMLKINLFKVTVFPFGISAQLQSKYIKSSEKEFVIAFAGPLFNLLFFWLCTLVFCWKHNTMADYCARVSLAMALVNLLPILPLDGGRMLKSILTQKFGIIRSYNFMLRLSRIIIFIMGAFSVALFFVSKFNFSLILISAFLIQNLSYEQKCLPHITLSEIIDNPVKLKRKTLYSERCLCANENALVSSILRHLGYDYFCIIHIVDNHSHLKKTVTETEVLEGLTRLGGGAKFKDI